MELIERDKIAAELPAWTVEPDGKAIVREMRFADFVSAFAFMTRIAMIAERDNHHPEWSNVYNRVSVRLTTHDVGGITKRDIALARAIDEAVR